MSNDIDRQMRYDMPPEMVQALHKLFEAELNEGSATEYSSSKELDIIIKRGKIIGEEEFRLIDEHVYWLCQSNPSEEAIENLNRMLQAYHESKDPETGNK